MLVSSDTGCELQIFFFNSWSDVRSILTILEHLLCVGISWFTVSRGLMLVVTVDSLSVSCGVALLPRSLDVGSFVVLVYSWLREYWLSVAPPFWCIWSTWGYINWFTWSIDIYMYTNQTMNHMVHWLMYMFEVIGGLHQAYHIITKKHWLLSIQQMQCQSPNSNCLVQISWCTLLGSYWLILMRIHLYQCTLIPTDSHWFIPAGSM